MGVSYMLIFTFLGLAWSLPPIKTGMKFMSYSSLEC